MPNLVQMRGWDSPWMDMHLYQKNKIKKETRKYLNRLREGFLVFRLPSLNKWYSNYTVFGTYVT